MSYLGQEQVRGFIDLTNGTVLFNSVEVTDVVTKEIADYLNDYYEKLAKEVNELESR